MSEGIANRSKLFADVLQEWKSLVAFIPSGLISELLLAESRVVLAVINAGVLRSPLLPYLITT